MMILIFSNILRWVMVLSFIVIFAACPQKSRKPDAVSPEAREPASAPTKSPPASKETPPPSKDPSRIPPSAPTRPSEATPPLREESYYTHTVKWSGETLFIIAAWYTGDRENWKALAEAMVKNDPKANIHRIHSGDKIFVPESLLKTREAMPREFVDNFYQKPTPEKVEPKPAPSQTGEEEPKLFGPKELPKK